jgi:hypothetical protein
MTLLVYSLSPYTVNRLALQPFQNVSSSQTDITSKVQSSFSSSRKMPIVELAFLVFYTGNIVIDLIANFITALPGMFNLLIMALCMLFNVPSFYAVSIKLIIFSMLTVLYVLMLIQFLLSIVSRGASIQ